MATRKYKGIAAGLDKLCRRFEEAREKHVAAAHHPKSAHDPGHTRRQRVRSAVHPWHGGVGHDADADRDWPGHPLAHSKAAKKGAKKRKKKSAKRDWPGHSAAHSKAAKKRTKKKKPARDWPGHPTLHAKAAKKGHAKKKAAAHRDPAKKKGSKKKGSSYAKALRDLG